MVNIIIYSVQEDEDDTEDSDLESRSYGPVSLPAHQHQLFQQHPLGLSKKEGTPPPPPPRTSRLSQFDCLSNELYLVFIKLPTILTPLKIIRFKFDEFI